jgi:hypothetical protein
MKSVVLAAGLLVGTVHGITTEGMLAAPRRSTGQLSAKGVRSLELRLPPYADRVGSRVVLGNQIQLDNSKVDFDLVLPRHRDRKHHQGALWQRGI